MDIALTLRDVFQRAMFQTAFAESTVRSVADYFNFTVDDIVGRSLLRQYNTPRHIAMFILYHAHLGFTHKDIGLLFQGRNHASSSRAIDCINEEQAQHSSCIKDIVNRINLYRHREELSQNVFLSLLDSVRILKSDCSSIAFDQLAAPALSAYLLREAFDLNADRIADIASPYFEKDGLEGIIDKIEAHFALLPTVRSGVALDELIKVVAGERDLIQKSLDAAGHDIQLSVPDVAA